MIFPRESTTTNWCSAPAQSNPPKWVRRASGASSEEPAPGSAAVGAGVGSVWLKADAPAGVSVGRPRVKSPLPVDLIRGPRGGGVEASGMPIGGEPRPRGDVLLDL